MGKFIGFSFLWYIFGNPFIAILVLLLILYMLDRRYVGLTPSMVKPFQRMKRISKLKQELNANPHDLSTKHELSRLLIERGKYEEARKWLEPMQDRMEHSAEFWDDLGTCYMYLGEPERGEAAIQKALELNPRVKYGQPYLRLARFYARSDKQRALESLKAFGSIHSSSCEMYYRMGCIYAEMDRKEEAKASWEEAIRLYHALPKYMKRKERSWMIKSRLKAMYS